MSEFLFNVKDFIDNIRKPKVKITMEEYEDLKKQIKDAEEGTLRENHAKIQVQKEFKNYKIHTEETLKFKDRKINSLDKTINEKNMIIESFPDVLDKRLKGQKGGYIKQINALKDRISTYEKQKHISDKEFKALEEKNNLQALKIKELLGKKEHTSEEYKQNGLPKTTKKALLKI